MPVKEKMMPDGFGNLLTASVIAHIVVLIIGGIFFKDAAERRIIPANYTVVQLVGANDPKPAPPVSAPRPAAPAVEPVPTPVVAPKAPDQAPDVTIPTEKEPAPVKPKQPDKPAKAPKKDAAALNSAIKKLALKAKKKEARSSVESRLEALRRKKSSASTGVKTARTAPVRHGASGDKSAAAAATGHTGGQTDIAAAPPKGDFKAQYPAYYSIVRDKIQNKWVYPEGLAEFDMLVSAHIKIGRNGALLEAKLEESSGNQHFDDSLINAIKKAAPFPPLPEEFENRTLDAVIRFCSSCGD